MSTRGLLRSALLFSGALALSCGAGPLGCATARQESAGQRPQPGGGQGPGGAAQAADFTLTDLSGGRVSLGSLRGSVVVLDFWASWCEPCTRELPELERLQRELASKGVRIVAVNLDKDRDSAVEMAQRLGLSLKVLLDPEGKVAERYNPPKMPTSYVIDRSGLIRHVHAGYEGPAEVALLRQELLALLSGPPAP